MVGTIFVLIKHGLVIKENIPSMMLHTVVVVALVATYIMTSFTMDEPQCRLSPHVSLYLLSLTREGIQVFVDLLYTIFIGRVGYEDFFVIMFYFYYSLHHDLLGLLGALSRCDLVPSIVHCSSC